MLESNRYQPWLPKKINACWFNFKCYLIGNFKSFQTFNIQYTIEQCSTVRTNIVANYAQSCIIVFFLLPATFPPIVVLKTALFDQRLFDKVSNWP